MNTKMFAGAMLVALALTQAPAQAEMSALPSSHNTYEFRCTNNEQLRVTFNADRHTAFVGRIRRPSVTLHQTDAASGFRFTRGDYELSGDLQEIRWRAGSGRPVVCVRGER